MQHHFPFTTAWKYNVWHCNFSHWNKQSTQIWDSCIQRRRAMLAPVLFAPPPSRAATLGVLSCTSCINFNRKAHILSLFLQSYYLVIGRQTQPHLLEMAAKRYIEKQKCVEMKYTSSNCNSVCYTKPIETLKEAQRKAMALLTQGVARAAYICPIRTVLQPTHIYSCHIKPKNPLLKHNNTIAFLYIISTFTTIEAVCSCAFCTSLPFFLSCSYLLLPQLHPVSLTSKKVLLLIQQDGTTTSNSWFFYFHMHI